MPSTEPLRARIVLMTAIKAQAARGLDSRRSSTRGRGQEGRQSGTLLLALSEPKPRLAHGAPPRSREKKKTTTGEHDIHGVQVEHATSNSRRPAGRNAPSCCPFYARRRHAPANRPRAARPHAIASQDNETRNNLQKTERKKTNYHGRLILSRARLVPTRGAQLQHTGRQRAYLTPSQGKAL